MWNETTESKDMSAGLFYCPLGYAGNYITQNSLPCTLRGRIDQTKNLWSLGNRSEAAAWLTLCKPFIHLSIHSLYLLHLGMSMSLNKVKYVKILTYIDVILLTSSTNLSCEFFELSFRLLKKLHGNTTVKVNVLTVPKSLRKYRFI